jgi:ferredoxin
MVLYFSGTGNSRYAAKLIGSIAGDKTVSMNERIKRGEKSAFHSARPYVFVVPAHAWRMPAVAEKFIRDSRFEGSREAYFVMTCAGSPGQAARWCEKLCGEKGFLYRGFTSVFMPNNYIIGSSTPGRAEAAACIRASRPRIIAAAEHIRDGKELPAEKHVRTGAFLSGAINPLFRLSISAKGFFTTAACNGCGRCEELCPTNNIRLAEGRPVWGDRCTDCMACICGCPQEAVEYRRRTQGKPRFFNTEEPLSDGGGGHTAAHAT